MSSEITTPGGEPQLERLWCLGELQTILAAGGLTGETLSAVEHEAALGHSPPWHRQPGDDETFYVLDGTITFWVENSGEPTRQATPGELVFIPRGVPHSFRVESSTARWLTISTPAGHERFYRAAGEPAGAPQLPPPGEPAMAKVQAAAREHGVELLGPPPGPERAHT
ncbi:MAG: cupin domain-containing protein [Actinomycetota bacterium]|nr:cupin domain-containing protein [Actinomycetota bacterium]